MAKQNWDLTYFFKSQEEFDSALENFKKYKDELASSILTLLNSESLLQEYSEKGYNNSLNFTWENTAIATLKAYEHVFENSSS